MENFLHNGFGFSSLYNYSRPPISCLPVKILLMETLLLEEFGPTGYRSNSFTLLDNCSTAHRPLPGQQALEYSVQANVSTSVTCRDFDGLEWADQILCVLKGALGQAVQRSHYLQPEMKAVVLATSVASHLPDPALSGSSQRFHGYRPSDRHTSLLLPRTVLMPTDLGLACTGGLLPPNSTGATPPPSAQTTSPHSRDPGRV